MSKRKSVEPAPGPLEDYAARFDDLFVNRAQRQGFRRYLEEIALRVIGNSWSFLRYYWQYHSFR